MKLKLTIFLIAFIPLSLWAQDSLTQKYFKDAQTALGFTWNPAVKSALSEWTGPGKPEMEVALGKCVYYFPLFDSVLRKAGLPKELKFLALATTELQFDFFDSIDGARGICHFNYAQARLFNLKITSYIDERLDPQLAAEAFARAMKEYYRIYQDWELAMAAFVSTAPKVNKAIRYQSDKVDYWGIQNNLEPLASVVVAKTAAAMILYRHSEFYKLSPRAFNPPKTAKLIYVHDWFSLDLLAAKSNTSPQTLAFLNPAYKRHVIPDMLDSFPLNLPANLKDSLSLVKQLRFEPYDAYYFVDGGSKATKMLRYDTLIHHVKEGETLENLAITYLVKAEEIMEWNALDEEDLIVDQQLIILLELKTPIPKPATTGGHQIYTVRSGDTLSGIASKYHCSVNNLKTWNNLRSTVIRPGQKLKVH